MGDGLTMYLDSAGLGDVGPNFFMFHEFGHHVQFGNKVVIDETSPESTRNAELMADALGAYFGYSLRGASYRTTCVNDMVATAYGFGDCASTTSGHHGTPNQRAKAVKFATNLIDNSKVRGKILKSADFITLFNAALPGILAPDAV